MEMLKPTMDFGYPIVALSVWPDGRLGVSEMLEGTRVLLVQAIPKKKKKSK